MKSNLKSREGITSTISGKNLKNLSAAFMVQNLFQGCTTEFKVRFPQLIIVQSNSHLSCVTQM